MDLERVLAAAAALPYDWIKAEPAHQLRALRERLCMSQRHLAEQSGVSHSVVNAIERGRDLRLSTWRRLFETMGYWAVAVPVTYADDVEGLILDERDHRLNRQLDPLLDGPLAPRRRRA